MGWTSYHANYYKNGNVDRKAEIENMLKGDYIEVLKTIMKGSTCYVAVKDLENEKVFGVVVLTVIDNKDYFNFSYKLMDETMGPGKQDCPKSILDLLSPTENEYAINWRNKCYENIDKNKDKKALKNLTVGTCIEVVMPVDTGYFKCGEKVKLVKELRRVGKRSKWFVVDSNIYFASTLMKTIEKHGCYEVMERGGGKK